MTKSSLKERVCKRINDAITNAAKEKKYARRTSNGYGIFIPDNTRGKFVKELADDLLLEKEILDTESAHSLGRKIFYALMATKNSSSIQNRADSIAKLLVDKQPEKTK